MSDKLPRKTIYAHGSLGLPLAVIGYPLAIWIPAHYSGGLGISLAAVGTILMLARLTDVITDPIMGELSDRWRTNDWYQWRVGERQGLRGYRPPCDVGTKRRQRHFVGPWWNDHHADGQQEFTGQGSVAIGPGSPCWISIGPRRVRSPVATLVGCE